MGQIRCDILLTDRALAPRGPNAPDETGGVVDFWGVVRGTEEGAEISGIDYEAHATMAEHQLRTIAEECARKFPVMQLIVEHRVGFVAASEASLFVRVGSRHRADAFRASQWIVDELKKRVPIWKHPRVRAGAALTSTP